MNMRNQHKPFISKSLAAVFAATLVVAIPGVALAEGGPTWHPESSERLVKLPPTYLQKTLDYDFEQSDLGQAMRDIAVEVEFKTLTLADLQAAIGQSDGEVRTELRHQFLAEKSVYIELAVARNTLQRQQLLTKMAVLDDILAELTADQASMTPARQQLIDHQQAARTRFEAAMADVDLSLAETTLGTESRYSLEFAANFTAIESLTLAIQSHSMNEGPMAEEGTLTKREYLRQMITDVETELALLDQQEKIIGQMAKLVALDAMALSNDLMGVELAQANDPGTGTVRAAIGFFVPN